MVWKLGVGDWAFLFIDASVDHDAKRRDNDDDDDHDPAHNSRQFHSSSAVGRRCSIAFFVTLVIS